MTLQGWTELLSQAAPAHHQAFAATDGDDPDWPDWYAAWLLERWPEAPPEVDQSRLAKLLAAAAESHKETGTDEDWPGFYARFLMERLEA